MVNDKSPKRKPPGVDEALDFGILLALAYTAFVDEMRAYLAAQGYDDLHGSFGYVARTLAARELTLRELADALQMTSPGALKIINDMESHGYVVRDDDPSDLRVKRLRLTPHGRAALAVARAFHARFEERLRVQVGARDAKRVREILSAIIEAREQEGAPVVLRPM